MPDTSTKRITTNDALVTRTYDSATGTISSHGKRVGAQCPLTYAERRVYVTRGIVAAVKAIMVNRSIGLREAHTMLVAARGPDRTQGA
jgi:hypothetical protein